MGNWVYATSPLWFALGGMLLLYLVNAGLLTFGKSYVERKSAALGQDGAPVAFTSVNVIPMDRERLLVQQTVVVRDGLIQKVGRSSEVEVPDGARVVDGAGCYLMPGLVDRIFLRDAVRRGDLLGPTIYTAGPIMEGWPPTSPLMPVVTSPAAAAASVCGQDQRGYDFIKVYDRLPPDEYQAIMDAASSRGLPVAGHVPRTVGLEAVLASGQATIEHLTGYIDPDAAQLLVPEERLSEYADLTRAAGVWNCPTLGLYPKLVPPAATRQLEEQPGMEYVSPRLRSLWRLFLPQMRRGLTYAGDYYSRDVATLNARVTRALHRAGAGVILGTDTANPYVVPGFSVHQELEHLVSAGLSPYAALSAATRNAAEAMGRLTEFGTIEAGKRADLVLLSANPLEHVGHTRQLAGVMARGQWLPRPVLEGLLDELRASYTPSWTGRLWPLILVAAAGVLAYLKAAR